MTETEIIRKTIHHQHDLRMYYLIVAIILPINGYLFLYSLVFAVRDREMNDTDWICLFLLAIAVVLAIVFRRLKKSIKPHDNENQRVEPYIIHIERALNNTVKAQMISAMMMEKIDKNCYGSFEYVVCLLFDEPSYNNDSFRKTKKGAIKAAKTRYRIPSDMPSRIAKYYNYVCFILVDKMTEVMIQESWKNAAISVKGSNASLNVFIDQTNNVVFLPAFCGYDYGDSATYTLCADYVLKVLEMLK